MWQKVSQPVDPMFRQSWVATFLIVSKMSRGTPIFLGQCTGKSCAKAYGFVSKYGNYRKTRWFKVFQSHVSHCLMVIWGTGHFQTHQNIIYQVGIIRLKYPCYLIIPVTSLGSFPTNLHYCWWEAMYIQLVPQLCQRFSHFSSTPLLLLWIALGTVFVTNSSRVVWTETHDKEHGVRWCKDLNDLKLTLVISPQFPHETIQPLVAVGLPCRAASSPVRGAPPTRWCPSCLASGKWLV